MLLGYAFTAVYAASFFGALLMLVLNRKPIAKLLRKSVSRYSIAVLIGALVFFVAFELLFVHPVEQLYFDENIYQGIALNILMHGNSGWCLYGTGYLHSCMLNSLYHDPPESSFFIAIAFALFGIGIGTAYALQLFMGALAIALVFLLASSMFESKEIAIGSTVILALMPQLFIWSRTQAVPDLPFMVLATFAFFAFVIFMKVKNIRSLYLFVFALLMALSIRIEGALLILVFAISYFIISSDGLRNTARERAKELVDSLNSSTKLLIAILVFVILAVPELYYAVTELHSLDYGQSYTSLKVFSLYNFLTNIGPNTEYFFGLLNNIRYYPVVFPAAVSVLAIIGVAGLLIDREQHHRKGAAIMLGLWFIAFFMFYAFFYAGAATSGVDVRFMLITLPPLSIFAALGIYEVSRLPLSVRRASRKPGISEAAAMKASRVLFAVLLFTAVMVPFALIVPTITVPVSGMPQEHMANAAVSFIYQSYNKVPTNCLVYTFTPDLWYELGRSAASVQTYMPGSSATKGYSCYVFDYGYWCAVPPYHSTLCAHVMSSYKTAALATSGIYSPAYGNVSFGLYELLNITG